MAERKSWSSSKLMRAIIVGAAAGAIGAVLLLTNAVASLENTTWDLRVRALAAPTQATDDVALVLIGQEDLDAMREQNGLDWPWPRSLYGLMVEFAKEAGAESFSIDLVLEDAGRGPGDNQVLQDAARSYGNTVYGTELLRGAEPEPWPSYVPEPMITVSGMDTVQQETLSFPQATFPHPTVIPSNAVLSFFNQRNDPDGVFRKYRLVNFHQEQPVLALGVAPVFAGSAESVEIRFQPGSVRLGDITVPLTRDGRVLLKFTTPPRVDPETGELLPAHHTSFSGFDMALSGFFLQNGQEPLIDPEELRGKHLLLGVTGSGLYDLRPTPLEEVAPGVTAHATMLDNLLSQSFMREAPMWLAITLTGIIALLLAWVATVANKTWIELLIFAVGLVLPVAIGFGAYQLGMWFPIIAPLIAFFLAVAAANVANYATEGAQKRFIRGAFGQYLSPDVVNQVVENPDRLRLGGERRELTMFFSDIQGFTTISEALDPEQLSRFLNIYLTEMGNIIHEEGGTIDKFEGDAIIAFWNAPLELADHPVRAVRTALKCQKRLAELQEEWKAPPPAGVGVPIYTRIGLNTGEVSVGNFGSESRFDYTALGDHMNLASRLEGSNKMFGTFVLISEFTRARLGDEFAVRELGRIGVVGRSEPIAVYEPMFHEEYQDRREVLETYASGLQAWYEGRLPKAATLFASIEGKDTPAARMAAQARAMAEQQDGTQSDPWDGVVRLTQK